MPSKRKFTAPKTTVEILNDKEAAKRPHCPECLSKNVGEENAGEGYCYDCGHQWTLDTSEAVC